LYQLCLAKSISLQELHAASVRQWHFSVSYATLRITVCTGLALVDAIASKDHSAIIYAGVRDPSRAGGASQLKELVPKYPGRIEIVKYVAGDKEGNEAIATEIKAKYGRVDTVIANAGEVQLSLRL
jgi:short-subunit dehydrogenase involved in D-alanine esterification of teichoic acids